MSLTGKAYAITGGASGIGLATAKLLSSRGAIICIADVDTAALEEASAYLTTLPEPTVCTISKVDVSNKDHGIKPLAQQSDDEWAKIMGVNLTGMMHCLRAELGVIKDKGSIVNMASIHGTDGLANHAAYAASKHGALALTIAAAKENGAREVRVNAVAPAPIYMPLREKYLQDAGVPPDAPFDCVPEIWNGRGGGECCSIPAGTGDLFRERELLCC